MWAGLIWIVGITALVLGPVENSLDLVEILLALLLTALASVIGSRQPGNRIALLLHVQAGVLLLEVFGSHVAEASQPPVSPGAWDLTAIVVFGGGDAARESPTGAAGGAPAPGAAARPRPRSARADQRSVRRPPALIVESGRVEK